MKTTSIISAVFLALACASAAHCQTPPSAASIFRDAGAAAMAESLAKGDVNGAIRGRSQGVDPNARGSGGMRPIHYVTRYAHDRSLGSLRALIAAGADVGAADDDGRTPLGLASARSTPEAVQILLGLGAKASVPSAGSLPALIAAQSANPTAFQLLALSGTPLSGTMHRSGSLAGDLAAAGLFENLAWMAQRGLIDARAMPAPFWSALCAGSSPWAQSTAQALAAQGAARCR